MRKHSHYFKPVTHLTEIDVYRTCDLFKVDDSSGATQHAIKKLLLPGGRGVKDRVKDLQEACDTIQRRIEMLKEDEQAQDGTTIVMGVPITVCREQHACDNMKELEKLKYMGARSVNITPRFYDELKSQAIRCPKCTTGGGPCYCHKRKFAEDLPEA